MKKEMQITKELFNVWKKDIVTKKVMSQIAQQINQINATLLHPSLILQERDTAIRLLGQRQAFEEMLNIKFEEEDNEEANSSQASS